MPDGDSAEISRGKQIQHFLGHIWADRLVSHFLTRHQVRCEIPLSARPDQRFDGIGSAHILHTGLCAKDGFMATLGLPDLPPVSRHFPTPPVTSSFGKIAPDRSGVRTQIGIHSWNKRLQSVRWTLDS
jgi:hypothetical protein